MQWFHGSPVNNIKKFEETKSKLSSLEGSGLYLTKNINIAKGYAGIEGSIYTCEINGSIFDTREIEAFDELINQICKKIDFNIRNCEGFKNTIEGLTSGYYKISNENGDGFSWQLTNLLNNDETFVQDKSGENKISDLKSLVNEYMSQFDGLLYNDIKLGEVLVIKNFDTIQITEEKSVDSLQK